MDSTFSTVLKMVEWFRNSFLGCLRVPGDEEQDRINDLPDHILSHILSFLPIKEAVQTSVLSKRWIDIWRFIISLDFDEGSFINSKLPRKFHNLENIVDKVCSPIIHSFTLSGFYSYHYDSLVHSWISSILERKIQKLDIYYPAPREFNFPSKLFECNALIEINLQLKNCFLNVHAPLHHPNLQILRLTGFVFKNCLSSSEVLLDFPLVKVFKLKECTFSNVQKLRISTPRAKRFVFKQPSRLHYYSIEVCAPSLTKLTLILTTSPLLMFIPPYPSSIQNASVEFYFSYHLRVYHPLYKPDPMHSLVCQLLQSIQAVKYLKLGIFVMWALGLGSNLMANLPTFKNLIHLQVEPMASFETLGYVLHKTPILKTLVCDKFFSGLMDSTLVLPTVVPPCFQSHLKRVTLSTFAWEDEGRGLAKFVLKNAKVLEQMTIILMKQYSSKDVDRITEQVEEELLKSPRGSPHVKVKVLWWRLMSPQIP